MSTLFESETKMGPSPAAKLAALAEALTPKIARLRADRNENTLKRQCQGMSARCEAGNLERIQRALRTLAEGWTLGTVPASLRSLRTRAAVEPLVTRIIEHPSYYVIRESDRWRDDSPLAVELRAYVAQVEGGRNAEQDAERARAGRIRALEEQIRFCPIPGFFPTPPALIERMVEVADLWPGMRCLEPSAGKGDIADALAKAIEAPSLPCSTLCIEEVHELAEICRLKGHDTHQGDFLSMPPRPEFDRVLMNPPFERNADAEHVQAAWRWLKPGGRLVAIISPGHTMSRGAAFLRWIEEVGGEVTPNEPEAFKGGFRPTSVPTYLLVADKEHAR